MMEKLSPSLRKKLCLYIFGPVLFRCPFLAWMTDDGQAITKLCQRARSEFYEAKDVFISNGEVNQTVFILLNGCVTLCLGKVFWAVNSNARTGEKAKEISKSRIPNFPNFFGLVLGCIEAKICK